MAKVKAAQINEQKQGTEQNNDAQRQADEQSAAMKAEVGPVDDEGVGVSADKQSDNDVDGDGYAASLIRQEGPSMRDLFAVAALQGMLANGTHMQRPDAVAYKAYEYADAMLESRGE